MTAPTFAEKAFPLIMAGIPVFPCNEQKRPLIENGFHAATTDMTTVGGWSLLYPSALVGVPTGTASGLDVVDVDVKKDEHGEIIVDGFASLEELPHALPPTVVNKTTRGEHHLYRRNGSALKSTASKVAPGIDTRGDGGYVIWWPAERGESAPPDIASLPETPAWVIAAAGDRSPAKGFASPSTGDDTIGEGSRNDTLYRLACTMQAKGFGDEAIRAAIGTTNDEQCVPPLSDDEVDQIVGQALKHAKGDKQTEVIGTMTGVFPKVEQQSTEWPDPKPIVKSLLPVLPFDYQLLPEPFIEWVKDTAERKCWAPDFLAVSLMAVAGTFIGRKVVLEQLPGDDWRIVCNQWVLCIGTPGSGKTPATSTATAFFNPFIKNAAEQFKFATKIYEGERKFHEAQVKALEAKRLALLKGDRNTEPDEQAARAIHAEIMLLQGQFNLRAPAQKRYLADNVTQEGLFDVMVDNPQGICVYPDELSRLLRQMLTDNFAALRGFMLRAANGNETETLDRRTDDRKGVIAHTCQSMIGSIQPDILPALLASGDDGMAQRFGLTVWPDPVTADPSAARVPNEDARAKVAASLARLDQLFMTNAEDQRVIPFSATAWKSFNEWRCRLLNDIERDMVDPRLATHIAKFPKVLGGLALIIAMVEGETAEVSAKAWEKARKWQPYLVSHLERMHGYARSAMDEHARTIVAKLTVQQPGAHGSIVIDHEGVLYTTARELQRNGLSGCKTSGDAAEILEWLTELGYVSGPRAVGSVRKAYIISPKVRGYDDGIATKLGGCE